MLVVIFETESPLVLFTGFNDVNTERLNVPVLASERHLPFPSLTFSRNHVQVSEALGSDIAGKVNVSHMM